MKHVLIGVTLTLLTSTQGLGMESLYQFEWKNRVLLIFGSDGDQKLQKQLQALNGKEAELADRDMVVVQITGSDIKTIAGNSLDLNARAITKEAGAPSEGFEVVLVGKDGGIKLRRGDAVSSFELFGLIDQMPMRQQERK